MMMHPNRLAGALAVMCLLGIPAMAGAGEAKPGAGEVGDPDAAAAFEGTVIERTLGEGTNETIVVTQGTEIRLVLHAAAGTELHLHGYDLGGIAGSEAPVVMTFRAEHAGRFPIEAHGDHGVLGRGERALAYIEVRPE